MATHSILDGYITEKTKSIKQLNFLVVMPRLVQKTGEGYQFPLGIAYISASLKAAEYTVYTLNLNHVTGDLFAALQHAIATHHIDVVLTGGISMQYNSIFELVKFTKMLNPNMINIVGGGLITAEPEVAFEALEFIDIGVIGEGEVTICELAHALEHERDLATVNGIIYQKNDQLITTLPRTAIEDIDSIPWPDYEGFELDRYLELLPAAVNDLREERMAFLLTSRSCPFSCTFCFHTVSKKYRRRSIASVMEELQYLKDKYAIKFVFLADELFGFQKTRLKEFCESMRTLNLPWGSSFRVNDINPQSIQHLKSSNCRMVVVGLESADNRILESMRKHITIEQTEQALKLLFDAEIPFAGNLIFGDIEETVETATNTLTWWENHLQYNVNLWPVISYPGSHLYTYACEKGIIKDRIQYLKDGCPAVNVSKMNQAEMSWLVTNLMEKPFQVGKNVKNLNIIGINPETKRVSLSGNCVRCNHLNTWHDRKLFISVNLVCEKCAQKHNTPLPSEIQRNIVNNVETLLERYNTLAVWGVTFFSFVFFRDVPLFQKDPRIIPMDNSASKQMMNLYGKQVHSPAILEQAEIPAVLVFYPNSMQQISDQIHKYYPSVNKIADVSDLMIQQ